VDLPPTTVGRDLYESVRRGDITQSSFGFTCVADAWPSRGLRELLDVNLIDVSPVTFPAYEGTAVGVRGMPGLRWYQGNGNVELTETERRKCRLRVLLAEMDDWKELFG
jgi:phage head maturation protease